MIIQRLIKILFISFFLFFNIKFSVVLFSSPLMSSDVLFFPFTTYVENCLTIDYSKALFDFFFINLKQRMDKISQFTSI